MKSRLLFRESGYPIRTRSRFDGWWVVSAILLVGLFYGTGYWIDHSEPLAEARGRADGKTEVLGELKPLLDRVYAAGREEGMALCLAPTGTNLRQVRQ